MSAEYNICRTFAHRIDGQLADRASVYIFGDENDSEPNQVMLDASVVFNWSGGAQVYQNRSTDMATVRAVVTVAKSGMTAARLDDIIDAVRAGVTGGWAEIQTITDGRTAKFYKLSAGNVGITAQSLPKQTQHANSDGTWGEMPVFIVEMQWIFYIWN